VNLLTVKKKNTDFIEMKISSLLVMKFIHFNIQMLRRGLALQNFSLTSSFHPLIYPYYFPSYITPFYLSSN